MQAIYCCLRVAVFAASFWLIWFFLSLPGHTREGDDHGNHGPLKSWFDGLASKRGTRCSFADGKTVEDVDWDTACDKPNCHYRVRLDGQWLGVPDDAVIGEPNKYGPAVVWPIEYQGKAYDVRCFMPGAGS